jgi:transposase InsO family protein
LPVFELARYQEANVLEILQLAEIKDLLIAPGLCHFHGMMEYWNNVLKTYNFSVRIKVFGINFYYLSMNIFIGSGDNHCIMAIMAFPNPPEADPFLMSKNFP